LGSPGAPEHGGGLDKVAAQLLSGRHITDDLYLLPENRAVQIQTSFETTPHLDSDRADTSRLQNLLWSSLSVVAKGRNSVALSTSADDRYIYLAVGDRENREPLKGPFGDYFRAPDVNWSAILPAPDLDYLRSAGAQIAADSDREPRRLVVRFPFGPAPGTGKPQHPGLRVLAIDDQEIIRDLLLNMFMGMGHRIKVCKSGEEGIDALKSEVFDLVLTDLGMPGMSGWEVAQAVKERNPDTPVVLITGWGFNFAEEQVRKAGVDYVLTKPFRLEHLTEVVETAIRRSPQVL
jgi:CheY-like chemotaxis protein